MTDRQLYLHYIDRAIEEHMKAWEFIFHFGEHISSPIGQIIYQQETRSAIHFSAAGRTFRWAASDLAHCDKGALNVWRYIAPLSIIIKGSLCPSFGEWELRPGIIMPIPENWPSPMEFGPHPFRGLPGERKDTP